MSQATDGKIKTVLIVFAMEAEAHPLIHHLGLKRDEEPAIAPPAPCVAYAGEAGGLKVVAVWNGKCGVHGVDNVGTVAAALTSYLAIQAFQPDLVISAGTAGGFKSEGAAIGDTYISTSVINHDRRISIPGYDKYGLGYVASVPTPNLTAALGLKTGIVSSGNSLDYTDKCLEIMTGQQVAVKEMEGAAIAWVCSLWNKPYFCLKSITDIVDGGRPSHEEFLENLASAAAALQGTLPKVLEFIAGKNVSEL